MAIDSLNGVRVLIVDDEPMIRETLSTLLTLEGAIISEASDGNQAFEMISEYDYNVILSDIRMPGCSGLELLNRIRKEKKQHTPPFVLMSAFSDISTSKAKNLGARGMFLKASDSKYLKEMLLAAIA